MSSHEPGWWRNYHHNKQLGNRNAELFWNDVKRRAAVASYKRLATWAAVLAVALVVGWAVGELLLANVLLSAPRLHR